VRRLARLAGRPLLNCSYRYALAYVPSRGELPHILNARGLLGLGAEIGVLEGRFSEFLLDVWHGKKLFCVDPWKEFPPEDYRDNKNVPQAEHDRLFAETVRRLGRFGPRAEVVRRTSRQAAALFSDRQLDFVFLDAQHHYEAVREDLALWRPKIRPGGILAGHDYLDGTLNGCHYGVRRAVQELAREAGLRVVVSRREPRFPSWFIVL
jgi:hypothetical protein